jgi:hypothetical protein
MICPHKREEGRDEGRGDRLGPWSPPPFPQKVFLRSKIIIIIIIIILLLLVSTKNKLIGPDPSPKKFMCFLLLF